MPKFHQSKDFNYSKPKLNNSFNKKKNWTKINVKGFRDWDNQHTSSSKWLKVTCLTDFERASYDICSQIEDLCSNSGRHTKLVPVNVVLSDGMLEFYMQMTKWDIDYIVQNSSKIDRYRVKLYKNEDIHIPHQIPSNWITIISQSLKSRYVENPHNQGAELNLSSFSEDKIFKENNLVLSLSSPRVLESTLNILKDNLRLLSKLNLSNNGLMSLQKLRSFISSVSITRLDVSDNRITNINELNILANSCIEELNVSGNYFRKLGSQELKKEIRNMLPNLRVLNGQKLEESVAIAGETLKSHKNLPEKIACAKEGDAYNFAMNFLAKFDCKSRDELCDFYSSESVLTLATHGETLPFYRSNSCNTHISRDNQRLISNVKRGKAQILGAYVNFSPTKHMEETIDVEIVYSNNNFMILVISGVFIELPINKNGIYRIREFTRNMTIVQNGIILQEFIQIQPNDNNLYQKNKAAIEKVKEKLEFARSHKDLEPLTPQDIEIVRQFKEFSRMNVPTCLRFLKAFDGLEQAMAEFNKLKMQDTIPPEAFRDE